MRDFQAFLNDLARRESGGDYRAVNKYGYIGKYQMGEMALVDCGYYKKDSKIYNNDWSGKFLGRDNIFSKEDFLASKEVQEKAQKAFKKTQWKYLKAVGADKYIGKKINGFQITEASLLAGAHLKGAGGVIDYLKTNGEKNSKDAFGTSIESYMKQFADYDVTSLLV